MKKTKQRIKDKARELFNVQGMSDTSLRNIAQTLGMSQGNLNYHYKVKQDLVEALYFELVDKMDEQMNQTVNVASVLSILYQRSEQTLTIFYEYRFLIKDLYRIFRENEKVKTHYIQLQALRRQQFLMLFEGLVAEGLMRQPAFEQEYLNLYTRMQILGDNWINAQECLHADCPNPVGYYNYILIEILYPYLTKKGEGEFQLLYQNWLKNHH